MDSIVSIINRIILKDIEGHIGSDETYSSELTASGKKIFGDLYAGTFPSDMIPKLTRGKPYAIINLDKSYMPGSHWIAIAYKDPKTIYVYDSFGRPGREILDGEIPRMRFIDSDMDVEQDISEGNCGARSLAWLVIFHFINPKLAMML